MKHAILACLLTALPLAVHADYVATEEEEAALRASIAKKPPTAETLTAQPYPGSKLDITCSASQSAPRQPRTMVYCFYTKDSPEKVEAYVQGPGKPAGSVPVFVQRGEVVDEQNTVLIPDVTHVVYYVSTAPAAARQPAAAAAPAAPDAEATPAAAAEPAAAEPAAQPQPQDDGSEATRKAVEATKKLKGLLGL